MTPTSYAIAAGHNVPLISMVNISLLVPPDDEAFDTPKGLPLYDDGLVKYRLTSSIATVGYALVTWFWTRMTYAQYAYLKSTFCAGGLSGEVTIYTTLGSAAYVRRNATLRLKKPKEMHSEYRYTSAEIDLVKLEIPS